MITIENIVAKSDLSGWLTAGSTVVLACITLYYALQAKKTVELMKKQNEMENKLKNTDLWDKALNEFFIPYKNSLVSYQMEIFENEQPDIVRLTTICDKRRLLWHKWSYRVFDEKERESIGRTFEAFIYYEGEVRRGSQLTQQQKTQWINDCDSIISIINDKANKIKTRLKYDNLS